VSNPVHHTSSSENSVASFPDISDGGFKVEACIGRTFSGLTAFCFEFVAKPDQAPGATLFLPAAIQSGLKDISGFAGSLVMVSDQEARLFTVIIFWNGSEARRSCERSLRRVRALLAPYLDRCLRVQNLLAHLPVPRSPEAENSTEIHAEMAPDDTCLISERTGIQEANVCIV
jgi:hypothetical protein